MLHGLYFYPVFREMLLKAVNNMVAMTVAASEGPPMDYCTILEGILDMPQIEAIGHHILQQQSWHQVGSDSATHFPCHESSESPTHSLVKN